MYYPLSKLSLKSTIAKNLLFNSNFLQLNICSYYSFKLLTKYSNIKA